MSKLPEGYPRCIDPRYECPQSCPAYSFNKGTNDLEVKQGITLVEMLFETSVAMIEIMREFLRKQGIPCQIYDGDAPQFRGGPIQFPIDPQDPDPRS